MIKCWRIDLWRSFPRYVDGNLPPRTLRRLEEHLLDCRDCRVRLAHVRTGDRMARQAPFFKPARDPWTAIHAAIESSPNVARLRSLSERPLIKYGRRWDKRILFGLALGLAIALSGWLLWLKQYSAPKPHRVDWPSASIDRDEFHEVSIAAIGESTEPHIAVEGYVAEVLYHSEENDLSFKLVENLKQAGPFIVCEIIGPIRLSLPPVGSRVRVYGVSRYDGQPDRKWYEVHPVMKIEMISQ